MQVACWVSGWIPTIIILQDPCCRQRIGAEASSELRSIEFGALAQELRWCADDLYYGAGVWVGAFGGSGGEVQPPCCCRFGADSGRDAIRLPGNACPALIRAA